MKETLNQEQLIKAINQGDLFIYPTDTIYGIGCDATNTSSVNKIKRLKSRDSNKPLSIIAPNKSWILRHCILDKELNLENYLPGPYTLLLKKKNPKFLSHVSSNEFLGIRMPNNKFCKQIQVSNKPFITTSINLSGEPPYTHPDQISQSIKSQVQHIINQGTLKNSPSSLIINGKEIKRK